MNKKSFLHCKFEVKEFDDDDEYFRFEGYASTFGNVDRGGDVVVAGCFDKCIAGMRKNSVAIKGTDYRKLMPILWQHKGDMPIGSFYFIEPDSKGLYVKGIMPKEDDFVRSRVMPQMKIGSVSDMSIGFMIDDMDWKDDVRYIKQAELFETSLVTIPMNPKANVTGYKAAVPFQDLPLADRGMAWDSDDAIARVREFLNIEDEPNRQYRNAFLWFDADDADEFGAYKLPIADIVDGQMVAVPRAIFAAAGALSGARGGVDIPDDERASVIRNVNRYYEKMGMESPFEETSSFRIDDAKAYTERELEALLKSGVSFSSKMAKTIISVLDRTQRDAVEKSQRDAEVKASLEKLLKTLT